MKSWTRTLNIDDAHTLLALAEPGLGRPVWVRRCHEALPHLSLARRRELIRLLRDRFLEWRDDRLQPGLFLRFYRSAPASAQIELVPLQWALSHPLTLVATERLVAPALSAPAPDIPLASVDALVREHLVTGSAESVRKTRTSLLGALESVGAMTTRGTGKHRSLRATHGTPHPLSFGFLLHRELHERGAHAMDRHQATQRSLGARLTVCTPHHAATCVHWNVTRGLLQERGDDVSLPT